jgi:hypothetical protein
VAVVVCAIESFALSWIKAGETSVSNGLNSRVCVFFVSCDLGVSEFGPGYFNTA